MKVATAKICLDCDELFIEEECPKCLNKEYAFLSKWLPPLHVFKEYVDAKKNQKEKGKHAFTLRLSPKIT